MDSTMPTTIAGRFHDELTVPAAKPVDRLDGGDRPDVWLGFAPAADSARQRSSPDGWVNQPAISGVSRGSRSTRPTST
jgi:hypothetical protein